MDRSSEFERKLRHFEGQLHLGQNLEPSAMGPGWQAEKDQERERLLECVHALEREKQELRRELDLRTAECVELRQASAEWKRFREQYSALSLRAAELERMETIRVADLERHRHQLIWMKNQVQEWFVELSRSSWFDELRVRIQNLEKRGRQLWEERKRAPSMDSGEMESLIAERHRLEAILANSENEVQKFRAKLQAFLPEDSPYRSL